MNSDRQVQTTLSLPTLLTLVFVTLKLCHVIDWSWWWVLSPIWITVLLVIIFTLINVILTGVYYDR